MNRFEFDMALQAPVFYMMRRGIRIDTAKKEDLAVRTHTEWDKYQVFLNDLSGRRLNVSSSKQVQEYLYRDLKVPPRMKDKKPTVDEDAIRAIMAEAEVKMQESRSEELRMRWRQSFLSTKLILKIREARKILSSYTGCPSDCSCKKPSLVHYDTDGRMRCTISVGGTETMRFAHSKTLWGTGMNLATVPHKIRVMFIADDDYDLCEYDLNRGESWVYSFLSMDPELIRIHTTNGDFHAETAAAIQGAFGSEGLTAEEIKRRVKAGDHAAYKLRYLGKKVNHASSYRMGPFRGAEVVNEESDETNITITPSQMKKAQDLWKGKYIGIKSWWDGIDRTLEAERKLTTPYGRTRQFFGFMSDSLKKEATAYVPQSTSVDYLNWGMLRAYNELVVGRRFGFELLHQNHDSVLVQYPSKYREEVHAVLPSLLSSTVTINGHSISIPVEGSVGRNWGDWNHEKNPDGLKGI